MRTVPVVFLVRCAQYLLCALALGLLAYHQLSGNVIVEGELWIIGIAGVAGATGPVDGVLRAWEDQLGPRSRVLDIEEPVKGLFLGILEETSLTLTDIGLTVFVVRRSRRAFFRRIQERVFRLRLESNPRPTDVVWTRRKGVLGECWRTRSRADLDHQKHFADIKGVDRWREWIKLPADVRRGLRRKDCLKVKDFKYVEAFPMIDSRGTYRGCVVVQISPEHKGQLHQDRVVRLINRCAATVATILSR